MERNTASTKNPSVTPLSDRPAQEMTGLGKLVFQITTASGAIPLEGARVEIRSNAP